MVVVLLVPIVVLLVPCLLALLERRVVAGPVTARTPVARRDTDGPGTAATLGAPAARVVPLRAGPTVDGDTLPVRRAS